MPGGSGAGGCGGIVGDGASRRELRGTGGGGCGVEVVG